MPAVQYSTQTVILCNSQYFVTNKFHKTSYNTLDYSVNTLDYSVNLVEDLYC